ncbi:hypothetical protein [Mycolicibacterium setense]|uniref:hypothetical protein n=1 Tax=Mycolicibacterium setense TaxID=431269 RepID=UPI000AF215D5|nr:hypothetical protein [Mycolicibacterium setense]
MSAPTPPARPYVGPRCRSCNGPCWRWKGDVWGYTCQACINAHLAEAAARADERDRQRLARKQAGATP